MAWPSQAGGSGFGQAAGWQAPPAATPSGFGAFAQGGVQQAPSTAFGFGTQPGASGFSLQQQQQPAAPGGFGFGQPQPPTPQQPSSGGFGFGQQQSAAAAGSGFSFSQSATTQDGTGFGHQQPAAQQPAGTGFGFGQQQPPASPGFGFGQQQQQPATTPGYGQQQQPVVSEFGFGQQLGASQGFGFGQQQQQSTASPGFGHLQQPGGFGFGQQQQTAQPAAAGFGFGQQAASQAAAGDRLGLGQQQSVATAGASFLSGQQQPPAAGFGFGQRAASAAARLGQPAPAPGGNKFAFGSAQRKKAQERQLMPPAATAAAAEDEGDGEEMDEAAVAAAKAAALANLPSFQGTRNNGGPAWGAAAGAKSAPPPPPPRSLRRSPSKSAAAEGLDAAEAARRAQRASRFSGTPQTSTPAPTPEPASARSSAVPAPALQQRQPQMPSGLSSAAAVSDMGEADADDDAEGSARDGATVGTCEDMCPAPERERRSRLNDIQIFERPDPANAALTSAELAVKRFARTIDDSNNSPEFFRTRGALRRTMAHLRVLLDRQDARLGLVHKFLWDRYRSVRQDLYIQGMDDEFSVNIYEEIVRFHLLSEHELCEEEASITEMEGFNSHLNMEQMNKALISLSDMYNKLAAAGRPSPTEAEFRAYHLLSLMGQHGKFKGDLQGFLSMLQAMQPEVQTAPPIQWVLKLQRAFASNNFVCFFKLVRQAPYLLACLSHIYFGQVRGRALRTLAETLAPKADTATALELSSLVETLMLDSEAEAQQLCAMHGFDTGIQAGVAVVNLFKGAYVDPPPPVPRKRSELITGMAPASRSLAVTTPCLRPMSAEEAAALERQCQERLVRLQQEEGQRARQAAELKRQQEAQAAAAAAAKQRRKEEEAAQQAEQARFRELEVAQRRAAQLAEQQRRHAELLRQQEEQRRQQEEQARLREQQLAEWRQQQQEQQRAAVEAERRRQEAAEAERMRRLAAEEAERQRLADLERLRLEHLQRLEEESRARREAKRRFAMQRYYLARWRREVLRRVEERHRQELLAANLKGCRVGMAFKAPGRGAAGDEYLDGVPDGSPLLPSIAMQQTASDRRPIDLPALAAPLLMQRSPAARTLYWKLLLLSAPGAASSSSQDLHLHIQHLQTWVSLQLKCGRLEGMPAGTAFIDGPVALTASATYSSAAAAELHTCVTMASSTSQLSTAGAAGLILVVPGMPSGCQVPLHCLPQPSSPAASLPTLLVAATDAAAQAWQQAAGTILPLAGPVHAMSVQQPSSAAGELLADVSAGSSNGDMEDGPQTPVYDRHRLVQGLRWLAAHAPPQPFLRIASVEALAHDALAATCAPLRQLPTATLGGMPAAQLYSVALQRAVAIVEQAADHAHQSAIAAWQWPPPEMAPVPLRSWHSRRTLDLVKSALHQIQTDANGLLHAAEGITYHALSMAAHMELAALEAARLPPLVLPPDAEQWFEEQLETAKSALPPVPAAALLAPTPQQAGGPSLRQKRKWQARGSPVAAENQAEPRTLAPQQRSWADVARGTSAPQALAQQADAIQHSTLWENLRQELVAEQQQALSLQEHAVLAASGVPYMVPESARSHAFPYAVEPAVCQLPLLAQLQQAANAERAATERLVRLTLQ